MISLLLQGYNLLASMMEVILSSCLLVTRHLRERNAAAVCHVRAHGVMLPWARAQGRASPAFLILACLYIKVVALQQLTASPEVVGLH